MWQGSRPFGHEMTSRARVNKIHCLGYIVWLDRKMTRVNRRRSQEPKRETTLDSGDTTVWRSAIRGKTIAPVRPEFLINVVFRLGCSKEEGVSKEIT